MKKVLVVDDSKVTRDAYQCALKDNYEFNFAVDGKKGILKVREFCPDVILLDQVMPGINGIETLKRMNVEFDSLPPVIMITGHNYCKTEIAFIKLGGADYMVKPINIDELQFRIEQVIRMRRLLIVKKQQEEELQELRAVQLTAGTLAHEVNNPLAAIAGNNDLLERASGKNKKTERIREGVMRIKDVVKKLTKITAIRRRDYPGDAEIIDLEESKFN